MLLPRKAVGVKKMLQPTEPFVESRRRRWISLVLRVGLSAALVLYLLTRFSWREIADAMSDMRWSGWLLALFFYFLSQVISGIRWAGLARAVGFKLSLARFQQLYFEGMFFSLCLPSSIGGDVVKAVRLGTNLRSRVLAGCTVVADRAAGMIALLLIGLTALAHTTYSLSTAGTVAVALGLAVAAILGTRLGFAVMAWMVRNLPQGHPVEAFAERLLPYHHHPIVFSVGVAWGLVVQGLNVLCVMALGFALQLDVPAVAYCVAVPLVALATAVPISLAGVGVREAGMAVLLAPYGLPEPKGIALGFLWLSVTVASGLVGGVVYLFGPPLVRDQDCAGTSECAKDDQAGEREVMCASR
jgi:uncharacterized membrane protein YbhN (UPF0104 family)